MGRIKAVMFDFDGTLVDTNPYIIASWRHVFEYMGQPDVTDETIISSFGEPLLDSMNRFFPGADAEFLFDYYRTFQKELYVKKHVEMYPGMADLMRGLYDRGIKLGIVTARFWSKTPFELYEFPVMPLLSAIVSAEVTDKHKPDPEPCLVCMEKLGAAPDECLLVGDSKYDIMCAHNAGVAGVMCGWSQCITREDLDMCRPEYTIEKAEDLYALID